MAVRFLIRALSAACLLTVWINPAVSHPLTMGAIAVLIAVADWLLIDQDRLELPPLGNALEALLASAAVLIMSLPHLRPDLTALHLVGSAFGMSAALSIVEWVVQRQQQITRPRPRA